MAAITPTAVTARHVEGDVVFRAYSMPAVVSDGDTLLLAGQTRVDVALVAPTTNIAIGVTIANASPSSTLTFHGGPWTGRVAVTSRIG